MASRDDPRSPNFVPMDERAERAKARWWAMRAKRKDRNPAAGVFDHEPVKTL